MDPTDVANMLYFWHRGADFMKDGTAVKLVYRMATVLDVKDPNAPRKTRELWKAAGATGPKVCCGELGEPGRGTLGVGEGWEGGGGQ
jgi:hypothetical protein